MSLVYRVVAQNKNGFTLVTETASLARAKVRAAQWMSEVSKKEAKETNMVVEFGNCQIWL